MPSPQPAACGMVLINLDAETDEIPQVRRPRMCKGTTRAGTRCGNAAGKASAYCYSHDPARRAA